MTWRIVAPQLCSLLVMVLPLAHCTAPTVSDESSNETSGATESEGDAESEDSGNKSSDSRGSGDNSSESGNKDEEESSEATGDESSTSTADNGEGSSDDSSSDDSSSESNEGDEASESTGDTDGEMELARDITLTTMTINQAVETTLAREGAWIEPNERDLPLVRDRPALLRVGWQVSDSWDQRQIHAQLIIQVGNNRFTFNQTQFIRGDAHDAAIDDAFFWHLEPKHLQPEATLSLALYETSPQGGEDPDIPPRIPEAGEAPLGVAEAEMKLRLTVVPLTMEGITPELDDAALTAIENQIYVLNPLTKLDLELHEAIEVAGSDAGLALMATSELRITEEADPNMYYIGVPPAEVTGWSGVSNLPGTDMNADRSCVSPFAAPDMDDAMELNLHSFVRRLGHCQGLRSEMDCGPTRSAGQPYDLSRVGYDVLEESWRAADSYTDYMSPCTPIWVDVDNYAAAATRIALLSSWTEPRP